MQYIELELTVGETVRIGDQFLTVIDLDVAEISVRIDPADAPEFETRETADRWPRK